jgi:putative ABC transport system substrate-binding protein
MTRRREFITLLGGTAAWPLAARAQQPAMPVIGVLCSSTFEAYASFVLAFRRGLGEAGFVVGQNVALEYRWADDQIERLPTLVTELVQRRVSLIAALGSQQLALAAKKATTTIPIVFAMGADPLQSGLVAGLNRPGGNITGITQLAATVISKRMQILHDLIPNFRVFGVLSNPDNNVQGVVNSLDAARALNGAIEIVDARNERDFEAAFARLAERRVDGLSVLPDTLFTAHIERLVALAARYAMPTIYSSGGFAKAGGLMSYGADPLDTLRLAGVYAGRILKGEKPGDLPVQQATKFEFVINLKTSKALGIKVPPTLVALADELIE